MKYFVNFPYTAETLKNEYRELCKKLHPDTGGNAEEFKNMMNEYEQTARTISGATRQSSQSTTTGDDFEGMSAAPLNGTKGKTFADLVARLVEVFTFADMESEYNTAGEMSISFGWDGSVLSPVSRYAYIRKFGRTIVEMAEKFARDYIQNHAAETEAKRREKAEEEAREAKRREEEARRREEEERQEAERIRKAQEETRRKVAEWAARLERIPVTVTGKKRAYDFADDKARAAYVAATKRNVKAVINYYFPGLDVKVTISGEIYKEKFIISWIDGPTEDEICNIPELDLFVSSYYASDPYADYGSYHTRQESAPWREAYGGSLGDCTDYSTARTLSDEGSEQAARIASEYFQDYDPAKMFYNNEQFTATWGEWCKFAEAFNIKNSFRCWENLVRQYGCRGDEHTGTIYYNSLNEYFKTYIKVEVKKAEKAPAFVPKYGANYKAIKKALSGNDFCTMQFNEKKNENDWQPVDIFAALLDGLTGVYICKPYEYRSGKHWSRLYSSSYTIAKNRREKFAALGIELENAEKVVNISAELRAALIRERADIENQRKAWEAEQEAGKKAQESAKEQQPTNTKAKRQESATASETQPETTTAEAPAEGLQLIETAEGVAVVADDWKTTYFNKRQIKAHGCHWNKEAKRWEATDPADVLKVRAWFALRDGFGPFDCETKTDEEIKAEAAAEIAHDEQQARAFAEAFATAADAMHEAVTSEPQSEPTEAPQSEPETIAEEIPAANDESATEPKQEAQTKPEAETAQDGRNCWAFVLLVSGKVARVMVCDWWATRSDAERIAEGMQIAAQGFRDSAHVAVYQRRTDGRYYFAFGKNLGGRDIFPPVAEIEGGAFVALYDPEPTPTDEAPTEATEAPTEGATVADNDSSTTANDESATEGATAANADTYKDPPRERIRFSPDDYQEAA